MSDVGRAPTIREHLEAIRDRDVWVGAGSEIPDCHCMVDVVETHDHAVAALALLDEAPHVSVGHLPIVSAGMKDVRLVPDPAPRGDADA